MFPRYYTPFQAMNNQDDKKACHNIRKSMKNIRLRHKKLHNKLLILSNKIDEYSKKAQEADSYVAAKYYKMKIKSYEDMMIRIRDIQKLFFNEHQNLQKLYSNFGCENVFKKVDDYLKIIDDKVKEQGANAALQKIMGDFDKELVNYDDPDYDILTDKINELVTSLDDITKEIHLFRNKLNRAPATLDEMYKINKELPKEFRWRMSLPFTSLFHMFNREGVYNIKFVSPDGKFEAVYNKDGVLLTQKNSPLNMSSYNYADPHDLDHFKYDMMPAFIWGTQGNFQPQQALFLKNMQRFIANHFATGRYFYNYTKYNYLN